MILNKEQQQVLDSLHVFKNSKEMEIKLLGASGTGKTTVLAEFVKDLRIKVAIATLSHKAKTVIRGKIPHSNFIKFHTLASLLNMKLNQETGDFTEEGKNPVIQDFDLIIIDECSMVSKETLALIRKKKSKKCKVIYAGDFAQLPPIGEKESALEHDVTVPKIELTQRVRQSFGSSILDFSDLYRNSVQRVIPDRTNSLNIKFYESFDKVLFDYREDFYKCLKNPDTIKVVCYRNAVRKQINNIIRETIFQKAQEIPYLTGDVIIMDSNWGDLENSQELTILNSEQMIEGNYLLYKIQAVKTNSFDKDTYTIYVLNQFSVEDHKKDVAALFDKYKKSKDRNVLSEAWNLKQRYADISYNYCIGSYKCQGSSYEKTVLLEDDIMKSFMSQKEKNQSMYVIITRSTEQTIIIKS